MGGSRTNNQCVNASLWRNKVKQSFFVVVYSYLFSNSIINLIVNANKTIEFIVSLALILNEWTIGIVVILASGD